MATFKYVAKDSSARRVMGKIVADHQALVLEELRKRNLIVISVQPVKEGGEIFKFGFSRKKVKSEDKVIFTRQLATMVEAGIPILQCLDALQEQVSQHYFRQVLTHIRDDIQVGSTLAAAFSKHPGVFDALFVNMIRVGETGGVLSEILDRVAGYLEKMEKLRHKVKSALMYPAVVVIFAMVITTVLLVKVVPTFATIYESMGSELPFLTQLLIAISNGVKKYFLFIVLIMGLIIFLLMRWYKTEKGRLIIDQRILALPVLGPLIRKVVLSRFSRTLSTLLQSGVPILESLDIVGKSSGNRVIELVVVDVKNNVREGESIAAPLAKSGVFPPMVTRMIDIGEQSGQLEKMLTKIAEFYDDQVDAAVAGLTSIIEPVIIGFLGVVIGFIVLALFLPILSISQFL